MPSILIAGCGYLGIATAKLFRTAGWEVTAWTRSGEIADHSLAIRCCAVDVRDREEVQRNSFACDLVMQSASSGGGDTAAYRRTYYEGATNLIASFRRSRLLFIGSTSVYAQTDGGWVNEDSPAEPMSAKGKLLRKSEDIVLDSGGTVLRLAGIYGPGRSFFLRSVLTGSVSRSGSAERYVNQIHRDDAASAILLLARQDTTQSTRIFNVVDDLPAPRTEILHWLSAKLGRPLCDSTETIGRGRADSNKRVSNAKLRALGWSPKYPSYREGFLVSVLPASGLA